MLKFTGQLVQLNRGSEEMRNYNSILAESPEDAAQEIFDKDDETLTRKAMVGDIAILWHDASDRFFFIKDDGRDREHVVRRVSEPEVLLWRTIKDSNPYFHVSIDKALEFEMKKGVLSDEQQTHPPVV